MSEHISETQSDAAPALEAEKTAEVVVSEATAAVVEVLTEAPVEPRVDSAAATAVPVAEIEVPATPPPRRTINLAELDSRYHQLPRSILGVP